jgi:site-specific recombinase XerD
VEVALVTTSTENISEQLDEILHQVESDEESLKPLAIDDGIEQYLESISSEVADSTQRQHRTKLRFLQEYFDQIEVDDWNDVDGRVVEQYQTWRRNESSDQVDQLSRTTMRDDMIIVRSTIRYLEKINAVSPGLSDSVRVPSLDGNEDVRDIELEPERAERILAHIAKYEYASVEHVVWLLHCGTGRRPGCLHALDCEDLHLNIDEPYIKFQHREDETRLENGSKSETMVNITDGMAEVLRDYLEDCRSDAVDEYGRRPLLTVGGGRLGKSSIRRYFYKWSRPCAVTGKCPHDRSPDECEAASSLNEASGCPSSLPPYAARHGHITEMRRMGCPTALLSERCDVSEEILEKHYDERSDEERRNLRRKTFDEMETEGGGYL